MKKKLIILFCLIVVVAIISYIYLSHHKKKPLSTVTAKYGNITQKATAVGNIIPKQSTQVQSQVGGIVSKIYIDSGSYVTKGENLILIKPNPTPDDLAKAISAVQTDKDQLNSDNQLITNYQFMQEKHVITKTYNDYINAIKTRNMDKNRFNYDSQHLSLLQTGNATIGGELVRNVVKSSINGFILDKNVNVGDSVVSFNGATTPTTLFSLADMKDLWFQGSVDEVDADKIKPKMTAKITLAAFPKAHFSGKVLRIALQSDNQNKATSQTTQSSSDSTNTSPFTNGFQININQLHIPKNITLRSGFSATASIVVKKLHHVLLIPERALVFKDNKTYVNLFVSPAKTKRQLVKTGIADGVNIQVISGLKNGQKVVVNATTKDNS